MINCQVWALCQTLRFLRGQETMLETRIDTPPMPREGLAAAVAPLSPGAGIHAQMTSEEDSNLRSILKVTEHVAKQLELDAAIDRINIFVGKMRWSMSLQDV